jgi:hypothetical protein
LDVAKWHYTTLPAIIPAPFPGDAKTPGPAIIQSPRVLMEHVLFDRKIKTERADLVDGRRVFRTRTENLWLMQKDANGYFVSFANQKYYWTPTNPVTESDAFLRKWGPL